jgi:dipeptidyl aminopeptidase/acylaminoacyl peptidase
MFQIRCAFCCIVLLALFQFANAASSPDDRQPTDAKAVISEANSGARPAPIEDLYYTRNVAGASWSPDGKFIAFITDMSGRLNLWKVNSSGGWPIQLTQSDQRQFNPVWSPDGKWLVFQQDSGGNELWDLYAVPSAGGEIVNLTQTPGIREESPLWSPDGKTLALNSKPKDSTQYDISLLDWSTKKVRRLTNESTKTHSWSVAAWSKDAKTLFANRGEISGTPESEIYAIDVTTGKSENLTPHQGQVLFAATGLSPDGKNLLVTSNQKNGSPNVGMLDIANRKITWITDTKWEAGSGTFSPDGSSFTYVLNQDGRIDAYLGNRSGHAQKINLPEGLNNLSGNPTAFSPSGDRLLISHESSNHPADLWIYNIASKQPTQLTFSAIASLESTALPGSQIVHYRSFDGKMVSALMWVPFNLKRDGTNPALVLPHGGPTGQLVDYWNADVAALSSRGYICIAPNVRGSTGYGLEFQKANVKDLGGGDLQDEVYAAKFLAQTGLVDPKKIGITGGSYGGFMTLMAVGRTPDVWAAAVEEYGIIDWMTMLQHEDPELQTYEKSLLGDPEKDRQVYDAASPITYIHKAKAPLLVLQGENDPRVPKEEAQQVVDLLEKDGKVVDVHYYPNEGHGFYKRENQIDAIRRTIDWFDKYLKTTPQ